MERNIDRLNSEFWNELCGSSLARSLGIRDHSIESLNRFDEAYLGFYPYLLEEVDLKNMSEKKVLEIGLGYGTLGQKIVDSGARYTGLDIAAGPVKMMLHRLAIQGLPGTALKGSILESPFAAEQFDAVISIGCFHHTGDTRKCIDETYRILKPGGEAYLMLYNQFSFRQWRKWPVKTFLSLLDTLGVMNNMLTVSERQRKSYDTDTKGFAAPETSFHSIQELKSFFSRFSAVRFSKQNCDDLTFFYLLAISRKHLLSTLGKFAGLDIYIKAIK
jgi:SAM-dependent methyltransferase